MGMFLYSTLLAITLAISSPWWLWRMLTSRGYRTGLRQRLGALPADVVAQVTGHDVIWLHAVSVGEVLAAEQLIAELKDSLPGWVIAISTTTVTGNDLAHQRLPGCPVFYFPLDFRFAVRRYLNAIRPKLVVLMESELWPRMLHECHHAGVPVAVVNACISDRSFPRYRLLAPLWRPLLAKVNLFLAQGDESAGRLAAIGVPLKQILVTGNLKFDAPVSDPHLIAAQLRAHLPANAEFLVCGSTLNGEERQILKAWVRLMNAGHRAILLIAPRHPRRFDQVAAMCGTHAIRITQWIKKPKEFAFGDILILDSIGSLAAVYQAASVAFLGGSLVDKGGHNPLEAARFGVPIIMGPSYENFREIVESLLAHDAISIVEDGNLTLALHQAITRGRAAGIRGREVYEAQAGATHRSTLAILDLLSGARRL